MKFYKYNPIIYRPRNNENLNSIADKFNTDISNIKVLSNSSLHEGEFVEIKKCYNVCHTVKPLENLQQLAKKYNVTIESIKECNNLKDDRLFIGQKLRF